MKNLAQLTMCSLALLALACGGDPTDADAGRVVDGAPMDARTGADTGPELCAQASDCDDSLYCSGIRPALNPPPTGRGARAA